MFFMYFCGITAIYQYDPASSAERGERILRWKLSVILDFFFPIYLSCSETLSKKCLHKCRFIHWATQTGDYTQNIHKIYIVILFQFIFGNKKNCSLFVLDVIYFLWLLSRSIEGLIFCHSFWSWKSQGKVMEKSWNLFC